MRVLACVLLIGCGSASEQALQVPVIAPTPTATQTVAAPSLPTSLPTPAQLPAYYPSDDEQTAWLETCLSECNDYEQMACSAKGYNPTCLRAVDSKCNTACAKQKETWLATFL